MKAKQIYDVFKELNQLSLGFDRVQCATFGKTTIKQMIEL
jgi:hypothetical protein